MQATPRLQVLGTGETRRRNLSLNRQVRRSRLVTNRLDLTPTDLEDYFEGDLPNDNGWLQKQIDKAVRELFVLCPALPTRLEQRKVDKELVVDVIAEAVLRVVRNPRGVESESEGNYNFRLNNRVASGDLWFPPEDVEKVCGKQTFIPRAARIRASMGVI